MRAGFLAVALLGGVLFCGCGEKKAPPASPPVPVSIVPATEGYMFESVTMIAEVKAYNTVNLVARVEGFLNKQLFEEGQRVKKDQLLYEIEPEVYAANVKAAEAELEKAKANQINANIDFERQKKLVDKDATSERAFDNAAALKQEADAAVKGAEAALALARQNLSYTKIHSPFDGQIGLNTYSEGNLVGPSSGTLATVVLVDPVRVEFVINELDLIKLLKLRKGSGAPEVRVRLFLQDGSEYTEPGEVAFWDNRVSATTGTLKLQALFPNPNRKLMSGMFVRVNIGPAKPHKKLLLPLQTLMSDQAGEYVYVAGSDGKVARREVKTGFRNQVNAVVDSGLKEGEKVIAEGVQKVRPGSMVAPVVNEALLGRIPVTAEAALKVEVPQRAHLPGSETPVDEIAASQEAPGKENKEDVKDAAK